MPNNLSSTVTRKVSQGKLDVPLLPGVVTEVMSLMDDPEADVRRLAALIHRDPGLAAHVLRVANSPAFSAASSVVSLQQAVSRLGLRLLGEVAVSAVLARSIFKDQAGCPQIEQLRRDSLATGVWAREVARQRRVSVDSAFLCGLLQRIGAPVALAEGIRAARDLNIPVTPPMLDRVMRDVEGEVGLAVATAWRLPSAVRACIAHRNQPLAASQHQQIVLITALAGELVKTTWDEDLIDDLYDSPLLGALNLYPDDVDDLLDRHDDVVATIRAMMR